MLALCVRSHPALHCCNQPLRMHAGHGHLQQHPVCERGVRGAEPPCAPRGHSRQVPARELLHHWQLLFPQGPARKGACHPPLLSRCSLESSSALYPHLRLHGVTGSALNKQTCKNGPVPCAYHACILERLGATVKEVANTSPMVSAQRLILSPTGGAVLQACSEAESTLPVSLDADGARICGDEEPTSSHRCHLSPMQLCLSRKKCVLFLRR